MPRLTKIYTRTGDDGSTSIQGQRVSKDDYLIEALGTIDELNAVLGLAISTSQHPEINVCLTQVQNDLFDLGGELYFPQAISMTPEKVTALEKQLESWNALLPPLEEFILPRGNQTVCALHVARTVCRRAERNVVHLHRHRPLSNPHILQYINRLSDVLFVAARLLAKENHEVEIMWQHEKEIN